MTDELEFDGERFTPESVREIWYEHMHRYAFARQFVEGLDVLDIACGEGYGSAMLALNARSVTGADISSKAIEHARQRYALQNLEFREADCTELPFTDDQFDSIVSFETIEHLENQSQMLAEFRRVLKPSGFLLVSSPDKAIYSDEKGFNNPHHVRELYQDEFQALLEEYFPASHMFGQKLLFYSAIWPLEAQAGTAAPEVRLQNHNGSAVRSVDRPVQSAMYLLAFCGQEKEVLPQPGNAIWLFDDQQESVYQHYQHEIRKNMKAGAILAERDEELAQLREKLQSQQAKPAQRPSLLARLGLTKRR